MADEACAPEAYPFTFYDANGTAVSGETNEDGLCIFPDANCGLDSSVVDCCRAKEDLTSTGSNLMYIAFAFIFAPYIYLMFCSGSEEQEQEQEQRETESVEGEDEDDDEDKNKNEEEEEKEDRHRAPSWVKSLPKIIQWIFGLGLWVYVTLQVMVPIFMRSSIQSSLAVASRNALISAEAFLVPYREIFQFIEDIVLVRVNYALGSGDKELTDQLVHAGIMGCLGTGLIAGVFASILGGIPPALSALTNPGFANDQELYPGCEFITDNTSEVLPYWMMEAWAISGAQLSKVMSGFLLGAFELEVLGWLGSFSVGMVPIIWFARVNEASNKLLLLGGAEFAADWGLPILAIVYIVSPLGSDLRENTGVRLSLHKLYKNFTLLFDNNGEETPGDTNVDVGISTVFGEIERGGSSGRKRQQLERRPKMESTRTLMKEGLKIMFMDVAIQFCISLTIYLALSKNGAVAYQLTALQAALPAYGIAYALGMGIMFKVAGPLLLAEGAYKVFAILARLMVVCAFLLAPLIVGAVVPYRTNMAFVYGENACTYAKDSQCLPFYTNVFGPDGSGGKFTLQFTFDVFAVGASVEAIFFVLRAILLSCIDLDYMVKCTGVALIVYIPVIIVATMVPPFGGEAAALFVAMYIPQVVLIVLFVIRVELLVRRMLRGEDGPWSKKTGAEVFSTRSIIPNDAQV